MAMVLTAPIADYVREVPARARVFERYGIDYCCGGDLPLEAACTKHGIDLSLLLLDLEECDLEAARQPATRDWSTATLTELTTHIVETHHAFLNRELPRALELADKVAEVHGAAHPAMLELRNCVRALVADLEPHMMKEENVLFPMMQRMDGATNPVEFPFGSIMNPIGVMENDHQLVGELLHQIETLTDQFTCPVEACNTWRALYEALDTITKDTYQHIHLENNILHPLAQDAERDLVRLEE